MLSWFLFSVLKCSDSHSQAVCARDLLSVNDGNSVVESQLTPTALLRLSQFYAGLAQKAAAAELSVPSSISSQLFARDSGLSSDGSSSRQRLLFHQDDDENESDGSRHSADDSLHSISGGDPDLISSSSVSTTPGRKPPPQDCRVSIFSSPPLVDGDDRSVTGGAGFFLNYKFDLSRLLHVPFRAAMDYLVGIGLTSEVLDVLYNEKYRQRFLQDVSLLEVSTGAGDCQLRALLGCILQKKLGSGESLSISEKTLVALCGFISDFGEKKIGKRSVLGCFVPEQVKQIEPQGFPNLRAGNGKKPLDPKYPSTFLSNVKLMATLQTLALGLGNSVHERQFGSVLLSGLSIPTLPHEDTCQLVLNRLSQHKIPHVFELSHFWSDERRGNTPVALHAAYDVVMPVGFQCSPGQAVIAFGFYTVNYSPEEQRLFKKSLMEPGKFEEFFLACARTVDAQNRSENPGAGKFCRELLIKKLMEGCSFVDVFHVSARSFQGVVDQAKYNNEHLREGTI